MKLNEYRKAFDAARFDPDFPERVMSRICDAQGGKETAMKKTRRTLRTTLIAASLALILCISSAAVVLTLRKTASADLGVDTENPISEYTEFEGVSAENEAGTVTLLSSLSSGGLLDAYVSVSPVEPELAAAITAGTPGYDWDIGPTDTDRHNAMFLPAQVAYDAETRSALVKVVVTGDHLEELSEIGLSVSLLTPDSAREFAMLTVPMSPGRVLTGAMELPVSCEAGKGSIKEVRVSAGIVEFHADVPALLDDSPAAVHEAAKDWLAAISEVLSDATVNYTDGTSAVISELESPYASWVYSGGELAPLEAGSADLTHICTRAIDLRRVVSVTVGGIEYTVS